MACVGVRRVSASAARYLGAVPKPEMEMQLRFSSSPAVLAIASSSVLLLRAFSPRTRRNDATVNLIADSWPSTTLLVVYDAVSWITAFGGRIDGDISGVF